MKKAYSKPDILFENFSLTTSIAGPCERNTHLPSQGACGYQWGAYVVFGTGMSGCSLQQSLNQVSPDGFCYHNPTDSNNLFNS